MRLISYQDKIAEVIVDSGSCKTACESDPPNVDAMLKKETIERIITQIKDNDGRRVRFKPGLFGTPSAIHAVMMIRSTDSIVSIINETINEKIKPIFRDHMSLICASDCNVEFLTLVIKNIIDKIGYTDIINDIFVAKSGSHGGRIRNFRRRMQSRRRMRSATRQR